MPETNYAGIDYSLGKSNRNIETGIHYGVISQNSLNPDAVSDFEPDYGEPHCPKCDNDVIPSAHISNDAYDRMEETGKDFACLSCYQVYWSEDCYPDESQGFTYESDGYKLTECLDNDDVFVLESPYYTFAQYCSPCVPGAGNLESPCADGPKTYCLGPDWFDSDSPMPYKCYRVSDGTEVTE